jgi:hypothetical protein
VFGGFIELNLAEPWSPARLNLIPIHLFVFGLVGLFLGAGGGLFLGIAAGLPLTVWRAANEGK